MSLQENKYIMELEDEIIKLKIQLGIYKEYIRRNCFEKDTDELNDDI